MLGEERVFFGQLKTLVIACFLLVGFAAPEMVEAAFC